MASATANPQHGDTCQRCGDLAQDLISGYDGRAYCRGCCEAAGGDGFADWLAVNEEWTAVRYGTRVPHALQGAAKIFGIVLVMNLLCLAGYALAQIRDLAVFLLLSMPFYSRYDFGNLVADEPLFSKMHPFAKLGIGFTYAEIDIGFFEIDDTGFLFVIGGGMAYEINDHLSAETTMQFNITTNDFFVDNYYFSWEIISLRYRF